MSPWQYVTFPLQKSLCQNQVVLPEFSLVAAEFPDFSHQEGDGVLESIL
jgi:hypothetical protein